MACGGNGDDPDTPNQSDAEDREEEPAAPLASTSEDMVSDLEASTGSVRHRALRPDRRCKKMKQRRHTYDQHFGFIDHSM